MLGTIAATVAAAIIAATLPAPAVDVAAPPEPEYVEEWTEPAYVEPIYDECVTTSYENYDYCAPSNDGFDAEDGITAAEFQYYGVVEQDGTRYTWYSQNVLPGGGLDELNANGRHVEGGYVMDADGFIAVASSDYAIGTELDTPFGPAKVYDAGCASGTVDVYVGW